MRFGVRRAALLFTTLALLATTMAFAPPVSAAEAVVSEGWQSPDRQVTVDLPAGTVSRPGDTIGVDLSGFTPGDPVELAVCLDDVYNLNGAGAPNDLGCTPRTPVTIAPDGVANLDYVIPADLQVTLEGKCGLTSWAYYGACSLIAFEGSPLTSAASASLSLAGGGTASVAGNVVDDLTGAPRTTSHTVSACGTTSVPSTGSGVSFPTSGSGWSFGNPDCISTEAATGEFAFGSLPADTYSVRATPGYGSGMSFPSGGGGSGISFGPGGGSTGMFTDNAVGVVAADAQALMGVDVPIAEPGALAGPVGYRGASMTVTPANPKWNDAITISGSGFRPGHEVNIGLCPAQGRIAIEGGHLKTCTATLLTADAGGNASLTIPHSPDRFTSTCIGLASCVAVAHETDIDGVGRWTNVAFVADGTATISGQVTLDGAPLPGSVSYTICGPIGCSYSYSPTAFSFPAPAEGDYTITTGYSLGGNHVNGSATVTVADDQPVSGVDVALDTSRLPTGSIRGKVTDLDGDPVPGVKVSPCKVDGGPWCWPSNAATTDDQGDYELGYLGDGTWRLSLYSSEISFEMPTPPLADVSAGAATTADIALPIDIGSGSIEAGVVDVHGQPLDADLNTCYGTGPTWSCRNVRTTSGAGSLGHLPDGEYSVRAWAGGTWVYATATVAGGAATDLTMTLPLAPGEGSIAGTVRDAGGDPVPSTWINFCAVDEAGWCSSAYYSGSTLPDGTFVRPDLPDGTYRVTANGLNSNKTATVEVTISSAEDLTGVDLTIPVDFGSGSIKGKVTDLNDLPTSAYLRACDGDLCFSNYSGSSDGTYTIANLPDGTYEVTAHINYTITSTRTGVEVTGGDATEGVDFQLPLTTGAISGHVYADDGQPMANTGVWACEQTTFDCRSDWTDSEGAYTIGGLDDGLHTVTVYGGAGQQSRVQTSATIFGQNHVTGVDLHFTEPHPVPAGVTVGHVSGGSGGSSDAPIYLGHPTPLSVEACAGATSATWTLDFPGTDGDADGTLTEAPAGVYTGSIPSDPDRAGQGSLSITVDCAEGDDLAVDIDVYIDPSGFVLDTEGNPIVGATVTLLRSTSLSGPFEVVPNGSDIMSPANRTNPDQTDGIGHFGWDVTAGYYMVTAAKDGCHAVGEADNPTAASSVYQVPPPVTDIELVLDCTTPSDETAPSASTAVDPAPNAAGWLNVAATVTLDASDEVGGSGLASLNLGDVSGTGSPLAVTVETDGVTDLAYSATDNAGNTSAGSVTVRVDRSAPTVSITSPSDGSTVEQGTALTASYTCDDTVSGIASCTGNVANGAPIDTSTPGTKTLSVTATDLAGNTTTATRTVEVTEPEPTSGDHVTLRYGGGIKASYDSDLDGEVTIRHRNGKLQSASAVGTVPGSAGGSADVRISVKRLWTTSIFAGSADIADASAKLYQKTPIVGSVAFHDPTASGASQWFNKRLAPYTLQWSMTDAG